MKKHRRLLLLLVFVVSFGLRLFGLNWDQGNHLHPDERMITMVSEKISLPSPTSNHLSSLLAPDSPLNPKFFAYGSLPIYLLKAVSNIFSSASEFSHYQGMNLLGRFLSAAFDSFSLIIIYRICYLLFRHTKIALLASLLYGTSVLPLQLSHFYAVDTLLNFFILLTIYHLIKFFCSSHLVHLILSGASLGLALATKVSAVVLFVAIISALLLESFLTLERQVTKKKLALIIRALVLNSSLLVLCALIIFLAVEPFAVLDFPTFWRQLTEQQAMTRNAFTFPYTLQYVGTPAYLYPLKNIFLWGLGPGVSLAAFFGGILIVIRLLRGLSRPGNRWQEGGQLIYYSFILVYFLITGGFAVKFMRYYLPIYPLLSIFGAFCLYYFFRSGKVIMIFSSLVLLGGHFLWLSAFLRLYTQPNTRVTATEWMNQHIPAGSLVLREHWDDGLPLGYAPNLDLRELALYESDSNPQKWPQINNLLRQGSYLIIASNRLYTPLQKMSNCHQLPVGKCYAKTAKYYQDLFSDKLGYKQVAQFENYPEIFGIKINDHAADESFTVYDHPKVMIFKKDIP